jgi:hypothetical protein
LSDINFGLDERFYFIFFKAFLLSFDLMFLLLNQDTTKKESLSEEEMTAHEFSTTAHATLSEILSTASTSSLATRKATMKATSKTTSKFIETQKDRDFKNLEDIIHNQSKILHFF